MRTTLIMGTALIVLMGADTPTQKQTDADRLQGTWILWEWHKSGQDLAPHMAGDEVRRGKMAMVFGDGKFYTRRELDDGQTRYPEGTFVLRPDRTPKEMDLTITLWPRHETTHGTTSRNIYKLEGDILILAYGPKDQPRPTRFKTEEGDGVTVQVYEREKPPARTK